jgi:hypothetical protein
MASQNGLCEWVEAHSKKFESIAERRNIDADMISRAQELVRAIIAEKQLILYGGQAIDYALRMKGLRIYSDDQIPDYDFYSPQHAAVSYELADRLVAEGFTGVDAIRAIHPQTMRVRVEYMVVADISFIPKAVFDRMPTLTYSQGGVAMKILHPDFQRADMHLAFCFPFSNPPREDIFHRYSKDLKRFHMFQECYPIECDPGALASLPPGTPKKATFDGSKVAVHGMAAYGILKRALEDLAKAAGPAANTARARSALKEAASVGLTIKKGKSGVEVSLVSPEPLILVTPWDSEIEKLAKGGKIKWSSSLVERRPKSAVISGGKVEVFSTKNQILVVVATGDSVLMATPQYLLMYFLIESFMGKGSAKHKKIMRALYASTLSILSAGGELLAKMGENYPPAKFEALVECSPFGLPVRPLGVDNRSTAYLTKRAESSKMLGAVPFPGTPNPKTLPTLYFPNATGKRPSFEPAGNPLFEQDGREL